MSRFIFIFIRNNDNVEKNQKANPPQNTASHKEHRFLDQSFAHQSKSRSYKFPTTQWKIFDEPNANGILVEHLVCPSVVRCEKKIKKKEINFKWCYQKRLHKWISFEVLRTFSSEIYQKIRALRRCSFFGQSYRKSQNSSSNSSRDQAQSSCGNFGWPTSQFVT